MPNNIDRPQALRLLDRWDKSLSKNFFELKRITEEIDSIRNEVKSFYVEIKNEGKEETMPTRTREELPF